MIKWIKRNVKMAYKIIKQLVILLWKYLDKYHNNIWWDIFSVVVNVL